jgi:hypothetical protein
LRKKFLKPLKHTGESQLTTPWPVTKLSKKTSRRKDRARRTLAKRDKTKSLLKELLLKYF